MGASRFQQVEANEFVVAVPAPVAGNLVVDALTKLGKVTAIGESDGTVQGRVRYGLQSAKVRVSVVEREPGTSTVVIQASGDDIWGAAARDVTKRLAETLRNLDNPGYRPDRLGVNPAALVGFGMGFVALIFLMVKYGLPLLFR